MASGGNRIMTLAYDGSASAQTIKTAGVPVRTVRVTNMTDGSEVYNDQYLSKHPDATKRGGLKVNGADGVRSWLTVTQGISFPDEGNFDVGSDAACNAAATQYHVTASD